MKIPIVNRLVYFRDSKGVKRGRPLATLDYCEQDEHGLHIQIRLTPHGKRVLGPTIRPGDVSMASFSFEKPYGAAGS